LLSRSSGCSGSMVLDPVLLQYSSSTVLALTPCYRSELAPTARSAIPPQTQTLLPTLSSPPSPSPSPTLQPVIFPSRLHSKPLNCFHGHFPLPSPPRRLSYLFTSYTSSPHSLHLRGLRWAFKGCVYGSFTPVTLRFYWAGRAWTGVFRRGSGHLPSLPFFRCPSRPE
jgi:hypothetical protein